MSRENAETAVQKTLFDRCERLPADVLHEVVKRAGGAAYLIAPEMVASSTRRLLAAATRQYAPCTVAYSYKTNYNKAFIQKARSQGAHSEVVSLDEFQYALSLGVPDREILFNGPGKTLEILEAVVGRDILLIVDSLEELRRIRVLRDRGVAIRARLGVRVTPALSFQTSASRFGIDLASPANRQDLRGLIQNDGLRIAGVHLHYTGSRSEESFQERLAFLIDAWRAIDDGTPGFIDCGGGYASAMPTAIQGQLAYSVATLETYGEILGRAMKRVFPEENVQLILEPGTGILSDAGVLVTPVLDVKQIQGQSVAVVDGTCFTVNPLRSTAKPVLLRVPAATHSASVPPPVDIYGNSCMEIDRLAVGFDAMLAVGDLLVFAQKGAYASCMAAPFIQGIPALVSLDEDNKLTLERPRSNVALLDQLN